MSQLQLPIGIETLIVYSERLAMDPNLTDPVSGRDGGAGGGADAAQVHPQRPPRQAELRGARGVGAGVPAGAHDRASPNFMGLTSLG
jgi:hypothetical protein